MDVRCRVLGDACRLLKQHKALGLACTAGGRLVGAHRLNHDFERVGTAPLNFLGASACGFVGDPLGAPCTWPATADTRQTHCFSSVLEFRVTKISKP